ncbi:MAG TPA: hypothetical protein VFJ29_01115 [Candidatus Kapabacteria bacterium]|nr:hypothetical protein [Candidatus Kapabacteria bacterium]
MDFSHSWWWIFLLLYGWLKYIQKEQKKRAAQQAAKQKMETAQKPVESTPDWIPSVAQEQPQEDEQYDGKIYAFDSPIAEEEREDDAARQAAYKFIPAEQEDETPQAVAKEYAFKPEGSFPAFEIPKENILAGEYFPQGMQSSGQAYLSAEDIRRSIITMEILLPPRAKRPHRVR